MTRPRREFLCGGERRVPSAPLPSLDPLAAWATAPDTGLRATWLGHSTVLIEIDGPRVLTDPVWGPRASPSRLAGPKRFQPVPVALRAMPLIDLVLVSHDHCDHLDDPTIRELAKMQVPFVPSLGGGAFLPVHWGTFSLALHDWDAPAETLLALGPKQGAQRVTPWWREVDVLRRGKAKAAAPVPMTLPKQMPWPVH